MVRRLVTVALFAGLVMALGSGVATADDLEDYLERAAEADFAGSQIVVSIWDGQTETMVIQIEQAGSRVMVGAAERFVDSGKVVSQGGTSALAVTAWNRYATDRYVAAEPIQIRRLGRDAQSVAIMEGDTIRARIVFDLDTGAPLTTEIFDGSGRLFRLSTMTQFDPTPRKLYAAAPAGDRDVYDVMVQAAAATTMPKQAGGYTRADVYRGPDDAVHAFFSDGFFTFSIFEFEGEFDADQFDEAVRVELDGARYERYATPTDVWVKWRVDDVSYLLVGDLPPDHLEDVLADLPEPKRPNLLKRVWRGLFG